MVSVSLAARKSKLRSAALNVVAIDPETGLALSVVLESAPASTPGRPLGGVAPPDQGMEAKDGVSVGTAKSVKVSVPEETVSKCVLPVVLTVSVTMEKPADPSTGVTTSGGLDSVTAMNPELAAVI